MSSDKNHNNKSTAIRRPSIYCYHDYRVYLKELLRYLSGKRHRLSIRAIAKESGIASGYLPMVLAKKRNLTNKAIEKLAAPLRLLPAEVSFLKQLIIVADSDIQTERVNAVKKLQSFGNYKKNHSNELDAYEYLTNWYYVAIREMSELPGFKLDAQWIQKKLRKNVSIGQINEAINFLISNNYLLLDEDSKVKKPDKRIECMSGVYRLSLGEYYNQMLSLGAELFERTPRDERNFLSHTVAITKESEDKVKAILNRAFEDIVAETSRSSSNADEVCNVSLVYFPLTKTDNTDNDDGSDHE